MLQSEQGTSIQRQTPGEPVGKLWIVNPDPKYSRVALMEPTTLGYILVGAEMHPRRAPFAPQGGEKKALLAQLTTLARALEQIDGVEKVTVFDALAFAPPSAYVRERQDRIRIARFDVVVLIETSSPAAARDVQTTPMYQALIDALRTTARQMYVLTGRNVKRIGDVDKTRPGVFLFNYFVGDDPQVVLDLWDYLAGWYAAETGLDNSTLLAPLEGEGSDYVAINNARWDGSLLGVFLKQITKPSFRSYMLANLEANHVGAMPVIYRAANLPSQPSDARTRWTLVGAITVGAAALGAWIALRRRRRASATWPNRRRKGLLR
jgi:hypothetical protein